jgi:hypothetical protein
MDTQEVYMVLDIIFTPLFEGSTSQALDTNISKPIWVKTRLKFEGIKPVYPTLALGVVSPFVVTAGGTIVKCSYSKHLEGIQVFGNELDIIEGISLTTENSEWDWKILVGNKQAIHKIHLAYKGLENFRDCVANYPLDNQLLKLILKDAELEC